MFEKKTDRLLPKKIFFRRVFRNFIVANLLLAFSLLVGTTGYHWIADLGWVDSFLNSSMILTGMGPVNVMKTDSAKIFASFYAIFSGVAFLTTVGILIAPLAHRLMHKFHLEDE